MGGRGCEDFSQKRAREEFSYAPAPPKKKLFEISREIHATFCFEILRDF